jgi:hypothetical protein
MAGFSFFYLDSAEKIQDWIDENDPNHGVEKAYTLLRSRFSKETPDGYLRNDVLTSPDTFKIIMCRRPTLEICGLLIYKDQKSLGDNFMEFKYFCIKEKT